ncbi:MAG: hypothetical protein ABIW84_02055, partial [Ilumatobacteraceae bacterium]
MAVWEIVAQAGQAARQQVEPALLNIPAVRQVTVETHTAAVVVAEVLPGQTEPEPTADRLLPLPVQVVVAETVAD